MPKNEISPLEACKEMAQRFKKGEYCIDPDGGIHPNKNMSPAEVAEMMRVSDIATKVTKAEVDAYIKADTEGVRNAD